MTPPAPPPHAPRPRVVIAGLGLLTPLGVGAWATFRALREGRTLTDRARHVAPDIDPVELVRSLGVVACAAHSGTDPAVELAERAAREAADEAGVELAGLPTFVGTSKGAVVRTQEMFDGRWAMFDVRGHTARRRVSHRTSNIAHRTFPSPHAYFNHHLTRRTGVAIRSHAVAACASSLVALDHARRFLIHAPQRADLSPHAQHGRHECALVLTAEASLTPLFIHSYRRLGVLAPLSREDYRELPFDERRQGFILAEAGAAVVLRRIEADAPLPPGSIELVDTATACDPHDLIRPNPEMAALRHIARRMFAQCGDHLPGVHAHAPGTPDHDPAELRAHAALLASEAGAKRSEAPDPLPPIYAAKGALGHTLGASGLVSLIIAALSARAGQLPPMPWLQNPMDPTLIPDPSSLAPDSPHAIFAAGFAGHTAGALLRRNT